MLNSETLDQLNSFAFISRRRRRMNRELFAFNSGNMRTESLENIVKTEMTDADSSNM